jgi:hypothetical protein
MERRQAEIRRDMLQDTLWPASTAIAITAVTDDQNHSLQLDALAQQGVVKEFTFTDKHSGANDARGPKGGRPPLSASDPRLVLAKKLYGDRTLSIDDVCRTLKISRSTHYRYVDKWRPVTVAIKRQFANPALVRVAMIGSGLALYVALHAGSNLASRNERRRTQTGLDHPGAIFRLEASSALPWQSWIV